jgi:cell division protein FtsQ
VRMGKAPSRHEPAASTGADGGPGAGATAAGAGPAEPAGPAPGDDRPAGSRARRPGWRAAVFALAGIAIVVGAAWALLGSRFLVVRSVQVAGTGTLVSRSQVLAAARIPFGQPLIRVDDGAVARRVGQLRQVESAHVSTHWPDTVVISVRPRVPVFAVAASGGYQVIDRFGVTLRTVAHPPAGLPVLSPPASQQPGTLRGDPAVRAAATVLGELPRWIGRRVRSVTAASASDVSVRLAAGTVIVWGDTSQASLKARELAILMHTHARLYDVSGPETAVTKG